jgi:hypothetical protein
MVLLKPDPTFYPSARMAMEAPPETHAYVAMLTPTHAGRADGLATVGLDPSSEGYGRIVNVLDLTAEGDELHHFGWNVCSAALCPYASHPHLERRYLVVPGLRSSRIYIIDTKDDPLHKHLSTEEASLMFRNHVSTIMVAMITAAVTASAPGHRPRRARHVRSQCRHGDFGWLRR